MVDDEFGVRMLYPSSEERDEYFAFPKLWSVLINSGILQRKTAQTGTFTTNQVGDTIIWYEYEPEDDDLDAGIIILPSSMTASVNGKVELEVDCDVKHADLADQGYTNDPGEFRDVEMTSWFFVKDVSKADGFIFMECRMGTAGSLKSGCCQNTNYGVKIFWDNTNANRKGMFQFYKQQMGSGFVELIPLSAIRAGPEFATFYQRWFAAKLCVYNKGFEHVRIELWLSVVDPVLPANAKENNRWVKVGDTGDFRGRGWGVCGLECDAPTDDYPIWWSAPFVMFGWKKTGKVVQFINTSVREIDPNGSFGEDPEPDPDPDPNPDPEPGDCPDGQHWDDLLQKCVDDPAPPPPPPPPDTEPPRAPTTMSKRVTFRREVINASTCSCDGVPPGGTVPPDPDPGGGGGGSTNLLQLYNVTLTSDAEEKRLGKLANNSAYHKRYGQGVTQTSSNWIGKRIARVEIQVRKAGNPTGSTTGGLKCVIRKGTDDSIAATLAPTVTEPNITTVNKLFVFENLTNNYPLVFGDKLLFEYDGVASQDNYIILETRDDQPLTGTKVVWQNEGMEEGDYNDAPNTDLCMKVSYIEGVRAAASEDDNDTI